MSGRSPPAGIVETALGYYINPLFSVFLGAVLLGERLNRAQMAAIVLAIAAVLILTLETGGLPWVSLALALSWAVLRAVQENAADRPGAGLLSRSAAAQRAGAGLYR